MKTLLEDEFEKLDILVSHVADAIEGLERGDNIIDEDETPRQVYEMVNKILERKDLSKEQRRILQKMIYVGYGLEDIAGNYADTMNELMETLDDENT
jgi:hypothetical protein